MLGARPMSQSKTTTPIYGLYGESFKNSYPGFVHIENIAERSNDLGWLIKNHRHSKLFQVICVFEGQLQAKLDKQTRELSGNWLILIPAGVPHGFRFQPQTEGFVLTIENSVLAGSDGSQNGELNHFIQSAQMLEMQPQEDHFQQFFHYIELIREEFSRFHVKRNDALILLTRLALLSLERQLWQKRVHHEAGSTDSRHLSKFQALLEAHYKEQWSVSDYATALNMSTSTLGRLCQAYMGESPKTILQERILGESRKRLLYTRQSIEEIAFSLGFKDQAYFSRFFKKFEKVAPGKYRKIAA